jgi:hypothetical protein
LVSKSEDVVKRFSRGAGATGEAIQALRRLANCYSRKKKIKIQSSAYTALF